MTEETMGAPGSLELDSDDEAALAEAEAYEDLLAEEEARQEAVAAAEALATMEATVAAGVVEEFDSVAMADEDESAAEDGADEPTGNDAPVEIVVPPPPPKRRRDYWQATGLATRAQEEFLEAAANNDAKGKKRAFYLLASYYGRTTRILNTALAGKKDPLARAAMQNLIVLHRPLSAMHSADPDTVPITLTLDRKAREVFVRDLIVRVLNENPAGLEHGAITQRVNDLDVIGNIKAGTVERISKDLVDSGHLKRTKGLYARASRTYTEEDLSAKSLTALLGRGSLRSICRQGLPHADRCECAACGL